MPSKLMAKCSLPHLAEMGKNIGQLLKFNWEAIIMRVSEALCASYQGIPRAGGELAAAMRDVA